MRTVDSLAHLMLAERRAAIGKQLRERTLERESARSRAVAVPRPAPQRPGTPCVDCSPVKGSV